MGRAWDRGLEFECAHESARARVRKIGDLYQSQHKFDTQEQTALHIYNIYIYKKKVSNINFSESRLQHTTSQITLACNNNNN